MKRLVLVFFLVLTTLTTSTMASNHESVHSQAQPARISAGGSTIGGGVDYATIGLNDPWDMDAITDIYNEETRNIDSSAGTDRMEIINGVLSGTSTSTDPNIYLVWPGYSETETQNAYPRYGVNKSIDADTYRYLVFHMSLSSVGSSDQGQVVWARDNALAEVGSSNFFNIFDGWHTYVIDLQTIGIQSGTEDWDGTMRSLRLDPTSASGVVIGIDWVRLVADSPAIPSYDITWSDPGGILSLYATGQNTTADTTAPIVTGYDAANLSYTWEAGVMPADKYYVYSVRAKDYVALALDEPWDMTDSAQIVSTNDVSLSFNSGIMEVTATGTDPQLTLKIDTTGTKIDPTVFDRITFRMQFTDLNGLNSGTGRWQAISGSSLGIYESSLQDYTLTENVWQTVTLDLNTGVDPGSAVQNWDQQTNVTFFRFDPVLGLAGVVMEFDWFSLSPTSTTPANESDLASAKTFIGPITVQQSPYLEITAPSWSSGNDYATTVLGDAWDMNESTDIVDSAHVALTFGGGTVQYTTDGVTVAPGPPPTGDPNITLRTGAFWQDVRTSIDPARYKYAQWKYIENRTQDTSAGSISRLLFSANDPRSFDGTTKDDVVNEGWNTYRMDMTNALLTSASTITWGGSGKIIAFRFDPDEFPAVVSGEVDYLMLTQQPWAGSSYIITWDVLGGDNSATVNVYYDADADFSNGATMAGSTTLGAASYTWDSSAVSEGDYYIHLEADDGVNVSRVFTGELPVHVKAQAAVQLSVPDNPATPGNFAKDVVGNAWDFNENNGTDLDTFGGGTQQITNLSYSNGILSGTSSGTDPAIFFNVGGNTINTASYDKISFRMYSGKTDATIDAAVVWYPSTGGAVSTGFITIYPGWGTYTVDLSGEAGWTGTVSFIRFDPDTVSGVNFKLDWFALTASNPYNISWTSSNFDASTTVSLYAVLQDTTDTLTRHPVLEEDTVLIAENLTSTSYQWDTYALDLSTYDIVALVDDQISDVKLVSSRLPEASIPTAVNALAGLNLTTNRGYIPVLNVGGGEFTWTATSLTASLLTVDNPGPNSSTDTSSVAFTIDTTGLTAGTYAGTIRITVTINGTNTNHDVNVTVNLVDTLYQVFLPMIHR